MRAVSPPPGLCVLSSSSDVTVRNLGSIDATGSGGIGVQLAAGGSLTNGAINDTTASISGGLAGVFLGYAGTATLSNFATISSGLAGVWIVDDATVDNSGSISGDSDGVRFGAAGSGTLTNTGTITASGTSGFGVLAMASSVTLSNLGSIDATGSQGIGVELVAGGSLTNGATNDTTAAISGGHAGVFVGPAGTGTLSNFATISSDLVGVWIVGNATVDNTGSISGGLDGVRFGTGGSGTLTNLGAIMASGTGSFGALAMASGVTLSNLGSIAATGSGGIGADLAAGDSLTNGASNDTTATISGNLVGVSATGAATVENFATISGAAAVWFVAGATGTVIDAGSIVSSDGAAGTAVFLRTAASRLVVDPGAVFVGKVVGSGGVLELAVGSGSTGAIGGIGPAFQQFATLTVDATASWTLQGSNAIGTIAGEGTLALADNATLWSPVRSTRPAPASSS